jgi:Holliday junction resolvase RusA-like endonuclease
MEEFKITIEGKPFSVNKTYKRGNGRRLYLSSEAMSYGDKAGWQARSQFRGKPLACDLEVSYYYYFADKRKCDHLNFNKLLNDRLNQIVWNDDRQIKTSHHYTLYDTENPRVELIIKPLVKSA